MLCVGALFPRPNAPRNTLRERMVTQTGIYVRRKRIVCRKKIQPPSFFCELWPVGEATGLKLNVVGFNL